MITELYVPRRHLTAFMDAVRRDFEANHVDFIYGTVRLIEKDSESTLPWARDRYACVIFNLHSQLNRAAIEKTAATFRRLLDSAIRYDGSYYLTYHRFARGDQVNRCYPQLRDILAAKARMDPSTRLDSDWYQAYKKLLAD